MKKSTLIILAVLLVIAGFVAVFAFINQEKLIDRYIQRQAANAFKSELLEDDEAFKLITVGTAAPLPSDRAQSCNVIIANGSIFVFDLGEGSLQMMEQLRLPFVQVSEVFISHWHSDHFMDLAGFVNRSWQFGRDVPLTVHGPPGVVRIVNGLDSLLSIENQYRVIHHGADIMNPDYGLATASMMKPTEQEQIVYRQNDIEISALKVNHDPVEYSYAYKVRFKDKTIVISGDCAYDEGLVTFAAGADILVHEAMQKDLVKRASRLQAELGNDRNAKILMDVLDYHATPSDAAAIAQKAGVKKLILSHLAPVPGNPITRRIFTSGLDEIYDGPIILADDGDLFTIE